MMNAGHMGDKPFPFLESPQMRFHKEFKAIFLWLELEVCVTLPPSHSLPLVQLHAEGLLSHVSPPGQTYGAYLD